MVKKLFHIADLHFRTYKRHVESKKVCEDFIEDVKKYILENNLKREECRIVIVGDIVHQKITISNELTMLVSWFLNQCTKLCPVIMVAGNHDLLENNMDRLDSLTPIIELMNNDEITFYKGSECYLDDKWCVYSVFEENEKPDIESARKEYGDGKKYIGLYHAPVTGAITAIGYEFEDSADLAQFAGCDAVLMGDIHHRQKFVYKGINIAYCGSLIQQDFGERVTGHGYLVWDTDDLEYTEHDIETDYGYYVFKIKSLDDIETSGEYITNS
jgi:DNA repair exonuclease SbcCD nuclease subunit